MEVHRLVRFMPKVVVCVVPGWAAGGGHSLHVVCDLTLASREHARFKQTDADVGSFDGGFGSAYLARQVGQKFAREIFFLGETYDAEAGHRMGVVNAVVPHADLERTALDWAAKINAKSPTSQRMLKYAFNLVDDGLVGQQLFRGRGDPACLHDRRGGRGPGRVPGEVRPGLGPLPLGHDLPRPGDWNSLAGSGGLGHPSRSPRSSERPAASRDHWAVGRPLLRNCSPMVPNGWGQPAGESSQVSCLPYTVMLSSA